MRIFERARIRREFIDVRQVFVDSGDSSEVASEKAVESMRNKYGATINWAKILEILLMLLDMFSADVQQVNGEGREVQVAVTDGEQPQRR